MKSATYLSRASRCTTAGFTVIELMVVVVIVAVLAALAAPSFNRMLLANRVAGATSEFQAALAQARGEAIKRGGDARVTVVPNVLIGTSADWTGGATVFFDKSTNANGGNATGIASGDLLLKIGGTGSGVAATSNLDSITFNGLGRPYTAAGSPGNGQIAFSANGVDGRCIIINAAGRTRVTPPTPAAAPAAASCPTR